MPGTIALPILILAQLSAAEAPSDTSAVAAANGAAAAAETLKERLSDKASDEQRVDNCGVPPDRRGAKPRPDCAESPPATTSRTGADHRPPG